MRAMLSLLCVMLATAVAAGQELNQFALFSLNDWGARKGAFVLLDNRYAGKPSELAKLRISVGVGDGSKWHTQTLPDELQYDKLYSLRVEVTDAQVTVLLDGEQKQQFAAKMASFEGSAAAHAEPEWARKPAARAGRWSSRRSCSHSGSRSR